MNTRRVINSIKRDRDRNTKKALICDVEDLDVYVARIARCNLALRRLAVRASLRHASSLPETPTHPVA